MRVCNEQECACMLVCLCLGVMKESMVYIFLCVYAHVRALSLIPEGLFGVFCAGFAQGGGGFLGSCIQM